MRPYIGKFDTLNRSINFKVLDSVMKQYSGLNEQDIRVEGICLIELNAEKADAPHT